MHTSDTPLPSSVELSTSRPWVQRNELGPLVHQLGHEIYDQAEVELLNQVETGNLVQPANYSQLTGLVMQSLGVVSDFTPYDDTLDNLLTEYRAMEKPKSGTVGQLTYYASPLEVLNEGLITGIVAPLMLYRAATVSAEVVATQVRWTRCQAYERTEVDFDAERAANTLVSPRFQKMLHFLALGANGSLGRPSTSVRDLGYTPDDMTPLLINLPDDKVHCFSDLLATKFAEVVEMVDEVRHEQFIYDEQGEFVDFTPQFKEGFLLRQRAEKAGWSGGCPVRHETFRSTGPLAAEYFKDQGQADGLPAKQGESLITRGSRFIATILAATVDAERPQ